MANDTTYSQFSTSQQLAGDKEADIRAQIASLQANQDYGSFATSAKGSRDAVRMVGNNKFGSQRAEHYNQEYDLSKDELAANGQVERNRQISALQGNLQNPLGTGRENDYYTGVKAGEKLLGPQGLGRLGNDAQITGLLENYRQQAETGYGNEQYADPNKKIYDEAGYDSANLAAQRSQLTEGIDRNTQTSSRALSGVLGRSGVKGAIAGYQQGNIYAAGGAQKAGVERDIFLKNADVISQARAGNLQNQQDVEARNFGLRRQAVDTKERNLQTYGRALGEVKTFDLGQAASEKNILAQAGFGFQQIGATERGATAQAEAAAQSRAASSGCHVAGTLVLMADLSYKAIESLKIGDKTLLGGKVLGRGELLASDLYDYNGIKVTGEHAVLDNGVWKRICHTNALELDLPEGTIVYPIATENKTFITNDGTVWADMFEIPNTYGFTDDQRIDILNSMVDKNLFYARVIWEVYDISEAV